MFLSEVSTGPTFFSLAPWIVFFPVIGLLINIVLGRRMGERFTGTVASLASFLAFVVSVLLAVSLQSHHEGMIVHVADWLNVGTLHIPWAFNVDTLSVTMMLVVSGIGTLIHIYAAGYMHYDVRYKEDPASYARFFVYLNLFIAFMMTLVGGSSYLMLFVGWEGVGLCSFLLIGFWFTRNPDASIGLNNSNAAKKAFITNRVGDFGFLIAMFLTFWYFGSLEFTEVFHAVEEMAAEVPTWVIPAIGIFMLVGVTGKSAQLPLYVWLPDAMAGPTPVSALIHAATMVTAGVYLVTRSYPIFEASHLAQTIVATVGAVTALFAATIAVGQYDIKKVLAYSTVSQLGFMVAAVGMGGFVAGMFHLVTHAFFKALLFLGAGSVILGVERGHHPLESTGDAPAKSHDNEKPKGSKKGTHAAETKHNKGHEAHHGVGHDAHGDHHHDHHAFDPQDMRNMGGLWKIMPTTFGVYLMGTLALAGIFPFAGFWSKDEILLDASHEFPLAYWLLSIAAFFTAFYMGRQIWMVFFGKPRTDAAKHAKESPKLITIPLGVLAFLSIFGGALNLPGIHTFGHWLEHTMGHAAHSLDFEMPIALISSGLALAAIALAWFFYGRKPLASPEEIDPLRRLLGPIFVGMNAKWWVDEFYGWLIIRPYYRLSVFLADKIDWDFWHEWFHDSVIAAGFRGLTQLLADPIDLGFVDRVSYWLAEGTSGLSGLLSRVQNGFARNYALMVFMGVVIIISYVIIR
ncbi:MAG: NADH-quinone oxidoreductase subunit L [Anaerolineales bacterium]|nr:NADH-quinone oxidoreductase subunit L [Anaerolineales bacterium]